MKTNEHFSDEILNAFIDEQLDHDERAEILSALRYDQQLTQRICDLQKVRSLVQLAYPRDLATRHDTHHASQSPRLLHKSIAAGILVLFGLTAGWFAHLQTSHGHSLVEMAETIRTNPAVSGDQTWQVMLHVSHDDTRRFDVLLEETEYLLQQYQQSGRPLQVEILANGKGINLLKDRDSRQAKKLQQLKTHYNNLIVSACGQTLKRMREESGQTIQLLPDTTVVRSAIHQVGQRQKQGWTYIHI